MYEIDYSDYDDQETESSQASGNLEKLNKSSSTNVVAAHELKVDDEMMTESANGKQYIKEHYMSNSDNELDEIDYRYHSKANNKPLKINQIIEDYKIEVGSINHQHSHRHHLTTPQLNNSKEKHSASVSNKLNQSTNPVIKNYLKTKEHDVVGGDNYNNNRISITTSNKKLNDLSKKSKSFKDLTKSKLSNSLGYSTIKTPTKPMHPQPSHSTIDKVKKPKSPSTSSMYTRQDSNLDEFQIEKVVSWMSVNEENFSEYEFSQAVNDTKGIVVENRDSTYQEIADIIKEIEHDRKDCEDFKSLKTDVEFKLNTILNSMDSPDDDSQVNGCNDNDDGEMGSNNKLK